SSIIVLGASDGALLGAAWVNSEWMRYRVISAGIGGVKTDPNPEGRCVIGTIYVSMLPEVGSKELGYLKFWPMALKNLVALPNKSKQVAAAFVYGDKDLIAAGIAKDLETYVKSAGSKKMKLTGEKGIDAGVARGRELIRNEATEKFILDYCQQLGQEKMNDHNDMEFKKNAYVWKTPLSNPRMPPIAKAEGEKTLKFMSPGMFIPR